MYVLYDYFLNSHGRCVASRQLIDTVRVYEIIWLCVLMYDFFQCAIRYGEVSDCMWGANCNIVIFGIMGLHYHSGLIANMLLNCLN